MEKKKRMKKSEERLKGTIKRNNICIIGIPEKEEERKGESNYI